MEIECTSTLCTVQVVRAGGSEGCTWATMEGAVMPSESDELEARVFLFARTKGPE